MSQVNSAHESESHLAALGGTMNCSNVLAFQGPFKKYITRLGGKGLTKMMTKFDLGGGV